MIAPVVAYLCHESNEDNGGIIISAAGWATKTYLVQGRGALLRTSLNDLVTPEFVRKSWHKVTDMTEAKHCESSAGSINNLMAVLEDMKTSNEANNIENNEFSTEFVFGPKDLILYALGSMHLVIVLVDLFFYVHIILVGASVSKESELKFLYENHSDFSPLPSFFLMPGLLLNMTTPMVQSAIKHTDVNLTQVILLWNYYYFVVKLTKC